MKYTKSARLFIISGTTIVGLGVGLTLGQPGFGLIIGLGFGLLLWGIIVVLKK